MANVYWTGATNDDWEETTNWQGLTAPVTGDNVWFSFPARYGPAKNMDRGTDDFGEVVVTKAFTHDVGTAGNPLVCGAGWLAMNGPGNVYCKSWGVGTYFDRINVFNGFVSAAIVDPTDVYVTGKGKLIITGEDATYGYSGGPTRVTVDGKDAEVRVVTTTVTTLDLNAGTVYNEGDIYDMNQSGGLCITEHPRGIMTNTIKLEGGICDYRSALNATSHTMTFNVYDGATLTFEKFNGPAVTLTINEIDIYGGTINLANGSGNVGVVTLNVNAGVDYRLHIDPGRKVTIADQ